jgi:hypothetical protein
MIQGALRLRMSEAASFRKTRHPLSYGEPIAHLLFPRILVKFDLFRTFTKHRHSKSKTSEQKLSENESSVLACKSSERSYPRQIQVLWYVWSSDSVERSAGMKARKTKSSEVKARNPKSSAAEPRMPKSLRSVAGSNRDRCMLPVASFPLYRSARTANARAEKASLNPEITVSNFPVSIA